MTSLREKWAAGGETLGLWLSVPSFLTAEITARQPVDYVCIDNQHGVNDYQQTVAMAQAILLGGGTPIARVPWNEPGIIGKMLDGGIEGDHRADGQLASPRPRPLSVPVATCRWAPVASARSSPACAAATTTNGPPTASP